MSSVPVSDFLDVLGSSGEKTLPVVVSSKPQIDISPLSFKQQKSLVTSGLNGIVGVMSFIKNLNDIIIENSKEPNLKIYDKVPVILALRKNISNKPIVKDDKEISLDSLISKFKKFDKPEHLTISGDGFEINLKIPTLKQENKYLANCIEDLKKLNAENVGKNVSLILSYELPKFIENITFNDTSIVIDELSIGDRNKIVDALPANITNQITDFIVKVREYDEELLTIEDTTVDIDYSIFE